MSLLNTDLSPESRLAFSAVLARWFPKATQADTRRAIAIFRRFIREGGAFPSIEPDDQYEAVYDLASLLAPDECRVAPNESGYDEETREILAWTSRLEAALVLGVAFGVQMTSLSVERQAAAKSESGNRAAVAAPGGRRRKARLARRRTGASGQTHRRLAQAL